MADDLPPEIQRIIERITEGWPEILDVREGWYPLLSKLEDRLAEIAPAYVVQQVKSKFGSLSFYAQPSEDISVYNDRFNEAIRAAEWESIEACEVCGAPARQYVIQMWVWTLCREHASDKRISCTAQ